MDELWRWLSGTGILAAFLWMAGKFYNRNIEGAIKEAKEAATDARKVAQSVSERVSESLFAVSKSQTELSHIVTKELLSAQKTWTEASSEIAKARVEAHDASKAVIEFAKSAEESISKLALGGMKLNEKIEAVKTEVKDISKELILIKNKKGGT